MNQILLLIGIGVFTGVYSGLMGLGGGTIMIPLMVLLLKYSQHTAVGTSLAVMLPPVTLPAVIQYWHNGNVKISTAAWIALGVVCGMLAGKAIASRLDDTVLKRVFGFVLIYVAGYTLFATLPPKSHLVRDMLCAGVMVLAAAALFLALRWHDLHSAAAA